MSLWAGRGSQAVTLEQARPITTPLNQECLRAGPHLCLFHFQHQLGSTFTSSCWQSFKVLVSLGFGIWQWLFSVRSYGGRVSSALCFVVWEAPSTSRSLCQVPQDLYYLGVDTCIVTLIFSYYLEARRFMGSSWSLESNFWAVSDTLDGHFSSSLLRNKGHWLAVGRLVSKRVSCWTAMG